jgi:hypothetical protein
MNIYKLHYNNKAQGDADLLLKGVYEIITDLETTQEVYTNGTQAIVYIGKIVKIVGTYDGETELTAPVYYDGVFYDIMTTEEYDFGTNEVFPENCVHGFLGHNNSSRVKEIE